MPAPNARLVKLNSRIKQAFVQVSQITDGAVGEFADDVSKMAAQLMRDKQKPGATGQMAASTHAEKEGENRYAVKTDVQNEQGQGYGAPQEWGWKRRGGKKAGKKVKGKKSIVRATFGMIKRWQRGERWRD